jgi:tetratricopeptide (TPR) repeat protein
MIALQSLNRSSSMFKTFASILLLSCAGTWMVPSASAARNETLNKAREAARHQEWEQVAELAQQAVNEDPNNEDAWALLGDTQMANGDTSSAVTSYEKALQLNPKLPGAVLPLTMYYLEQDRMDAADRVVTAAEEKDKKGKFDEIKVARGQIQAARGDMAEATRILASATRKNPKNPLYPQILARIYENKRVLDLAEKYYADAWALSPGDPVLAYEYALVLLDLKKYNEALELFKQVQEKDPSNRNVDYMIGRLYYAARRWAEAATQFERACEKRPDHFLSHYLLGKSYFEFSRAEKLNFYPQAEKALRRAHELKPERKDVTLLLADVLATEGKLYYQRAAADTLGAKGPLNDVFLVVAKRRYTHSSLPAAQDDELKNALRKAKLSDSLAQDVLPKLDEKAALLDSAILLSHQAFLTDSAAPSALSQIGRAWDKLGNLDSAVQYAEGQHRLTPEDANELARLVNVRQRRKDDQALVDLLRPHYEALDWSVPKAAGDTASTPQDKFLDRYAGVYVNSLIESGKSAQARETLRAMLKYKPGWCDGHALNAYIDLRRQDYEGAIPVLQAAVRACPQNADLWVSLGDSWYFSNPKKKDNVAKAKEAYLQACNLGANDGCDKFRQLSQ